MPSRFTRVGTALHPYRRRDHGQKAAKRELIDTGTDKRYVRRKPDGTFNESDDVRRSLGQDQKR